MKNLKTFEQFINEDNSINEAKWEVLGSMGDFQVFPDKEKGDHIILIIGKGGDQREYPIYLKKRDTADKLRDRYYRGKQINVKESVITEKVKEVEIGKTYKVSKNFRSGSNSINKGTEIEILDIGNNFAEVEVFDGPFGMGTKMELEISDLEKYLVESEINERRKPITKKHWDKADDDQREEWLLQAFEDPDDAMEYVEMDWNDLPPVATSNMYESL